MMPTIEKKKDANKWQATIEYYESELSAMQLQIRDQEGKIQHFRMQLTEDLDRIGMEAEQAQVEVDTIQWAGGGTTQPVYDVDWVLVLT